MFLFALLYQLMVSAVKFCFIFRKNVKLRKLWSPTQCTCLFTSFAFIYLEFCTSFCYFVLPFTHGFEEFHRFIIYLIFSYQHLHNFHLINIFPSKYFDQSENIRYSWQNLYLRTQIITITKRLFDESTPFRLNWKFAFFRIHCRYRHIYTLRIQVIR